MKELERGSLDEQLAYLAFLMIHRISEGISVFCKKSNQYSRIYLHFDPAVHRLEDLSVVDGMDLDQQGQTLGYYGRKGKESEGDRNAS